MEPHTNELWKTSTEQRHSHSGTLRNTNVKTINKWGEWKKISLMVSDEQPSCNFDHECCSGSKQLSITRPGILVLQMGLFGRHLQMAEHKPRSIILSFQNLAEFISWIYQLKCLRCLGSCLWPTTWWEEPLWYFWHVELKQLSHFPCQSLLVASYLRTIF